MNDKNRNLVLRIVSALVLLPAVIWLLWRGGWWSAGLMAGAAAVCASEYYQIVFKRLSPVAWLGVLGAGLLPLLPVWVEGGQAWTVAFFVTGAMFVSAWTYHLLAGPLKEAPGHAAHAVSGLLYGGLGLASLSAVRLFPEEGLGWVIAALVLTWLNDTCAYFAGRAFGKHKLYPEVSPNKTWEGFFGGMAGSVAGMFILKAGFYPFITTLDCLALGLAAGILGPVGDLVESMLKRAYGVKDSGKILPGHGGLLDRIDALVFNAPLVLVWVAFVRAHL